MPKSFPPRLKEYVKSTAALVKESHPEAEKQLKKMFKALPVDQDEPDYYANKAQSNLDAIRAKHGLRILAQTIEFFHKNGFQITNDFLSSEIGARFAKGHGDYLRRALKLLRQHRLEAKRGGFPFLVEAVEASNDNDLKTAMRLAPRASKRAVSPPNRKFSASVTKKRIQELVRGANQSSRYYFALACGKLGLERLTTLVSNLRKARLHNSQIIGFVANCGTTRENPQADARRAETSVKLARKAGLKPSGFVGPVEKALQERQGTPREISTLLGLAKKHGVQELREQDLRLALRYYRQPSTRKFVETAFRENKFGILAGMRFYDGLTQGMSFVTGEQDEALRALDEQRSQDAHASTAEKMQPYYRKEAILPADRELVSALAANPLFEPGVPVRKPDAKKPAKFDEETIRVLEKLVPQGARHKLPQALSRIGSSAELKTLLTAVPTEARAALLETAAAHEPGITRLALGVAKSSCVDPATNLEPIAFALAHSSGKLVTRLPRASSATSGVLPQSHHEQQIKYLQGGPLAWQPAISRAVAVYRKVYVNELQRMER